MSDRSLWLTAQQQLILMMVCVSGYGFVVYISSTLAGGSQIQGQPGLHSKTLYLFFKDFYQAKYMCHFGIFGIV